MSADLSQQAQDYLRRLRLSLAALPENERDEIVAEIKAHFAERHARGDADVLAGFDAPEEYASHFVTERALSDALAKGTSLALGRSLLAGRLATISSHLLVLPIWAVQLFAIALLVVAALKPFIPDRVGLFVDASGGFAALGAYSKADGGREALGWWALPLFVASSAVLLWACNRTLRLLARWRLRLSSEAKTRRAQSAKQGEEYATRDTQ